MWQEFHRIQRWSVSDSGGLCSSLWPPLQSQRSAHTHTHTHTTNKTRRVWGGYGVRVQLLQSEKRLSWLPGCKGQSPQTTKPHLSNSLPSLLSPFPPLPSLSLQFHVTAGAKPAEVSGYVQTSSSFSRETAFAVDCEMCYTTAGLELTSLSVVDMTLQPVYEAIVLPPRPIVDYNTR